jgi:hypothetical protein
MLSARNLRTTLPYGTPGCASCSDVWVVCVFRHSTRDRRGPRREAEAIQNLSDRHRTMNCCELCADPHDWRQLILQNPGLPRHTFPGATDASRVTADEGTGSILSDKPPGLGIDSASLPQKAKGVCRCVQICCTGASSRRRISIRGPRCRRKRTEPLKSET